MTLWLDLETYSPIDIKSGAHKYAERAEILLFAYALDDGPVSVWDATEVDDPPAELVEALKTRTVWAHNAAFDRTILRHCLPDLCPPIERWRCTSVMALEHSLPASLGQLCEVLKIPTDQAKDKAGKRLIQLFCKPRPSNVRLRRATSETHPIEWARFVSYATADIVAMRECAKRIPNVNFKADEIRLYHLDQRINDRGIRIDLDLAKAAVRAIEREQARLAERTHLLTDGAVGAATQRDALLKHLSDEYSVELPDLQKASVERLLASGEMPAPVQDLLAIRLAASSTSTAKYLKLLECTGSDGRLRGTLQFCGAARTGRDGGRLFQPQNLPRGKLKPKQVRLAVEALKADCEDMIYDDVMDVLTDVLRATIIASVGCKLVVADLANVEGRVAAWLADEYWKLDAFRDYDEIIGVDDHGKAIRKGHDLYCIAYGRMFNKDPAYVVGDERQCGKVAELALQYGGGANAFATFARTYGIDLDDMAVKAKAVVDPATWDSAGNLYRWMLGNGLRSDLSEIAWTACDSFKRLWRESHPGIVGFWAALNVAMLKAIAQPGKVFDAGRCQLRTSGPWLFVRLPSGRYLCYPGVRREEDKVSYMGIDQFTRKWTRIDTYGAKLFENIVQSVSRDLLFSGATLAEARGYPVTMRVHDELVCETPDTDEFTVEGLAECMTTLPTWAEGLPLAAAGYEDIRYRKG